MAASSGGATSTAAPKGTDAPADPDGIKTADAQKVVVDFFKAYYAGETEAQQAVATGAANLFTGVDLTSNQATGKNPTAVPAKLEPDFKSITKDGDSTESWAPCTRP